LLGFETACRVERERQREMSLKPWLRHYDEGVPASLAPYPPYTLLHYIGETASQRPEHPAVIFRGARLSYSALEQQSDAFAAALAGLGVKKGDRVALVLPNCPQFLIAELGVWKIGAVLFPLNPLYAERELQTALSNSGAETAIVLSRFYEHLRTVRADTALERIIVTNIKEYLPPMLRILFTLFRERKEGHRVRLTTPDLWFQDLLAAHRHAERQTSPPGPDDPAIMLLSGGTTGTPKGVVGLHRSLVAAGLQLRAWMMPGSRDWSDIIMLPLPLFHVYANVGVQTYAIVGRHPLLLVPNPRDIDDLLSQIRRERPSFLSAVPTLFIALLNHPDVAAGKADFSSVRICFSGAAPLMAETKRRFEALTGGRIVEGYSLTEAMMATFVNPVKGPNKIASVGMPLPDVDVKIVDADQGEEELSAGQVGEIIIRAPQLMKGYWRNPEETAIALRVHGTEGVWLHTGDLGYLDEDGYLFIVDRKKDLIKTSGYQVWPREIEEVLASHPAVAEVGVAGIADTTKGEYVKAWVVLRPGMTATEEELRAFCRDNVAPYKVPRHIEFRSDLPKTLTGKVLRRALVADEHK
jgi:long-chain acyl-CoA synthetase